MRRIDMPIEIIVNARGSLSRRWSYTKGKKVVISRAKDAIRSALAGSSFRSCGGLFDLARDTRHVPSSPLDLAPDACHVLSLPFDLAPDACHVPSSPFDLAPDACHVPS